jgi:hypothetical protein
MFTTEIDDSNGKAKEGKYEPELQSRIDKGTR